jgi:DNA (cytosine-5)-methyltransferase 1
VSVTILDTSAGVEQVAPEFRATYDLFAAAGGWDHAFELVGRDPRLLLGFEWSPYASTTARSAGYARLVADVSKLDVRAVMEILSGLLGGPPCQGFSPAGSGLGRRDIALLIWAIREIGQGRDPRRQVAEATHDERSVLVLEPLRWALHLQPVWMACEQVPAVLPIWEAYAEVLRANGYSAWCGILHAEQYDVPQSRRRAVLLASREVEVTRPAPVRSRYHAHDPAQLDPGLDRWLSIGDVLPHRIGQSLRSNYGTGGDPARRGMRRWNQPAATVTSKINRNRWSDGTAVSIAEASRLQTFPAEHPWYGSKAEHVTQQIGDAVPPMLGAHCLAALGVGDLARARAAYLRAVAA